MDIFERLQIAHPSKPVLLFAPLEGVGTPTLRTLLDEIGGMDLLATGFIRITNPRQRIQPPLRHSRPLQIQLMASSSRTLSACVEHQKKLQVFLDSDWLDLNSGCPSRRVNRHQAGAALLKKPLELREMIEALRKVHPGPLSAKIRIGSKDSSEFPELLKALADAPLDFLTIHARPTEALHEGPVAFECLTQAVAELPFPVVANGSIWSAADALTMLHTTHARGLMCGRGVLANPYLFHQIRAALAPQPGEAADDSVRLRALYDFTVKLMQRMQPETPGSTLGVGAFKELGFWLSKNPLIGPDLFESLKRVLTWTDLENNVAAFWGARGLS